MFNCTVLCFLRTCPPLSSAFAAQARQSVFYSPILVGNLVPCIMFPQLVFGTIITLANATLLLKLQPYVSNSDDTVSTLASWVTFFQVLRQSA